MKSKRKPLSDKKALVLGGGVIVIILLGLLWYHTMKGTISSGHLQQAVSPMHPNVLITPIDANSQRVFFPVYGISFDMQSNFIHRNQQDAANIIDFSSPDASFEHPSGKLLAGVETTVTLANGWHGFVYQGNTDPAAPEVKQAYLSGIDTSLLPTTNPLITPDTAKVYFLPVPFSKGANYFAEAKLVSNTNPENIKRVSINCYDAGTMNATNNRCRPIIIQILSSLTFSK